MMNREDYVKQIPDYQYMRETVKKDENRLHFHLMPSDRLDERSKWLV